MSPKWSHNLSKNCLKIGSKMEPENDLNMTPKWSLKFIKAGETEEPFLGSFSCFWQARPKMAPIGPLRGSGRPQEGSKRAPRGLQEGSKRANMAPRGPKIAPRGPLLGPRKAPRGSQDGQDGAKRAHDGSKMAPGRLEEGPRQPKMAPKRSQDGSKWLR